MKKLLLGLLVGILLITSVSFAYLPAQAKIKSLLTITQPTTAEYFNVKRDWVGSGYYDIAPHTGWLKLTPWTAPVNMIVIGVELTNFITVNAAFTEGGLEIASSLSTDPTSNAGSILNNKSIIQTRGAYINASQRWVESVNTLGLDNGAMKVERMFFPSNTGIWLSAGDNLTLTVRGVNSQGEPHFISASALIYYIER